MADDNNGSSTSEVVNATAPAEMPAPKKQRGPRKKITTEAAGSAVPVAKSPKGTRQKRSELISETKPASVEAAAPAKGLAPTGVRGPRKYGAAKQAKRTGTVVATAVDEVADLLQLEEENKRLRKTLAEKLRAENADLRKRLGIA
ncbi:SyrB-like regulator [Rhizobium sp. BK661]|uniref:SyrB-like regulator n=1 Tax=Rhizobium sp. BK661 TaxID=2586991 RepID=UPI0021692F94|nr:SyrB-like regulator [Rhizobium sp. BK661]MCS3742172.1 hypothetical protein [Rhizobium sp. BK661]